MEHLSISKESFLTWFVVFVLPGFIIGLMVGAVYEGLIAGLILASLAQFLVNRPF